jgi:hypothetical protein
LTCHPGGTAHLATRPVGVLRRAADPRIDCQALARHACWQSGGSSPGRASGAAVQANPSHRATVVTQIVTRPGVAAHRTIGSALTIARGTAARRPAPRKPMRANSQAASGEPGRLRRGRTRLRPTRWPRPDLTPPRSPQCTPRARRPRTTTRKYPAVASRSPSGGTSSLTCCAGYVDGRQGR